LGPFPAHPAAVTSAWLSDVLGARVRGFSWEAIGTGQVADSVRYTIDYADEEGAGPPTLAAKFAAADPTSRATAAMFALYTKEVHFYREAAPLLEVRTPRSYLAEVSADGSECCLLFEDMGPARQGDQVAGCAIEDARAGIRQAAAIHGPSWQRPELLDAGWLAPRTSFADALMPLYAQAQAVFRERYGDALAPELMAVCEGLAELAPKWFKRSLGRQAIVHGDFRLDNMLFDIRGGAEPIAILDWQTAAAGDPLTDIGYFLGCGVGEAMRRAHETELLALYRQEMARYGVIFQDEVFARGYRLGALHGVATAVFSAAHVERTERGDANFLSMARGACSLALAADSLSALAEE
jgi:hypothetical protein